jgi:antitoxin YefM
MKTLSYSHSRARSAETLDAVVNDREDVVVTRPGHDPVAIVSVADYESLKETAYLLQSPANARRLINSIERTRASASRSRSNTRSTRSDAPPPAPPTRDLACRSFK